MRLPRVDADNRDAKIASDLGELSHAASKVGISGYSKTKQGQKRPRPARFI